MDVVNNLLFWIHLAALGLGGAASFGMPVVASRLAVVPPEVRPTLLQIMHGLSKLGRAGIGALIVTGPLIVWLKYGGFGGLSHWFWAKMLLVVVLLAGVIYSGILLKRVIDGGPPSPLAPRIGIINTLLFLAVILTAVLAFE